VTRASFKIETKPLILPHTSIEPIDFRTLCKKAKMRSGQTMKRTNSFSRPTQMKIALFRSLFSGLPNAHGIRDPKTGRQFQFKRPVTDQVVFNHLKGKEHYGVYLLNGARTKAVVAATQRVRMASTGRLKSGRGKIRNHAAAARLLSQFSTAAQENLFSIAVDKNDSIVEVHRYRLF